MPLAYQLGKCESGQQTEKTVLYFICDLIINARLLIILVIGFIAIL
jgi:hypothetical protein